MVLMILYRKNFGIITIDYVAILHILFELTNFYIKRIKSFFEVLGYLFGCLSRCPLYVTCRQARRSLAAAKTLQAKHGIRPPENFTKFNTSKKDLTFYERNSQKL
jgi:hypothetical protein